MLTPFRHLARALVASPLFLLAAPPAHAQETPCRKLDLSNGLDCRIEVAGGCKASCTPLKFEAYCKGGCTGEVTQTCTGDCSTLCMQQCDPDHLDCVAGCHNECEQPCIEKCEADHPGNDCVTECKASCNMHCDAACGVTVDSCLEHCRECCNGACSTQVNFECDLACFAELEGGCEVQCDAPTGALFCNGQYVFASDVNACITYLAQQGVEVNVEARGSVSCDFSGCSGDGEIVPGAGEALSGCAAEPGRTSPFATTGVAAAIAAIGLAASRRRDRRSSRR